MPGTPVRPQLVVAIAIGAVLLVLLLGAVLLLVLVGSGSDEDGGSLRYVALGDSYTAAPGIPDTDPAGGCRRSDHNYPSLLEQMRPQLQLVDRSCSGATTMDAVRSQYPGVGPQLSALTPGTDLVTVGLGGNDEGMFATVLYTCAIPLGNDPDRTRCSQQLTGGKTEVFATIDRTQHRLVRLVERIHQKSPGARVVLVGYPQVVAPGADCSGDLPLSVAETRFFDRVVRALNDALRSAAETTVATYLDVYAATRGHGMCSDDPWINDASREPDRAVPFHPFIAEQRTVARLLDEALGSLGAGGPSPAGSPGQTASGPPASSAVNPSSSSTGTPSSPALSALEPALSPATT